MLLTKSVATSPLVVLLSRLTRLGGVVHAAISTREGLMVATAPAGERPQAAEARSATTAALFGSLDRALPALGLGTVDSATVETSAYTLFLRGAGRLVLTAVAERGADRSAVQAELSRVAGVLARHDRAHKER